MSSLILVTCDSGAGHLKQAGLADRILTFTHRLVAGPIPIGVQPETFFQARKSLYETEGLFHEQWWFEVENLRGDKPLFKRIWSTLPAVCLQYDRITLWVDPDPNAQLVLLQLLDWLGSIPEIAPRLWLKQSESPIGERRPGDWVLPPRAVDPADIVLARRAWLAFGAATPERWAALRDDPDLDRLSGIRRAVEVMLDELPDGTGLGATARRLLRLAGQGRPEQDRVPERLLRRVLQRDERTPFWYFEVGETLCELAAAPVPAVTGVTERHYDLALHDDAERFRRFCQSPVLLTDLGCRLIAGTDDWSQHNPVHRWWGGTRLTNAAFWRWDAGSSRLLASS